MALAHFGTNHFAARHFFALYADRLATDITDTDILHKPIDYALAGDQHYRESGREWDFAPARRTENVKVTRSGPHRIAGEAPSFTTKTGSRGYD